LEKENQGHGPQAGSRKTGRGRSADRSRRRPGNGKEQRIKAGETLLLLGYDPLSATNWWTRSPNTNNSNNVWNVNSDGDYNNWNYNNTYGVRPALMDCENE